MFVDYGKKRREEEGRDRKEEWVRRGEREGEVEGRVREKAGTGKEEATGIYLHLSGTAFSPGFNLCQYKRHENQVWIHGESIPTLRCAGRQPSPTVDEAWFKEESKMPFLVSNNKLSCWGGLAVQIARHGPMISPPDRGQ